MSSRGAEHKTVEERSNGVVKEWSDDPLEVSLKATVQIKICY